MTEWIRTAPQKLLNDFIALLLGILLTFAFAPYQVFPLAPLALGGLLFLFVNTSPSRAFWLGFVFGLGLFGRGVYWVYNSIHDIGEVPVLLSFLITFIMVAYLSLYPAIVGYLMNRYFPETNTMKIVCVFPAIWLFCEWIRGWLFTGFPWLFVGYSQTNSPLSGYASIFSVYGVSLAVALTSGFLVNSYFRYKQQNYRSLYWNLIGIFLLWIAGFLFTLIPWTAPSGNPIPVSLVQGNIPQTIKWDPSHIQLSLDRYKELTAPLWGKNKLIVWPESVVPLPLQDAETYINDLDKKAKETGSSLILGIPIQAANKNEFYNAIITLGQTKSVYLKRRLVPFGEYTPYSSAFSRAFNFMNIPMSNMIPGEIIQAPLMIDDTKILPSLCYEIAFPELMRTTDPSIGFLLTLTNDAWFGESNAQAQHLQMAQMRAMEFKRPLLFVSNDGITAIIGPNGNIELAAPPHQAYVLNGNVQPMQGLTPWMKNGTDPIFFILICLIGFSIYAKKKREREKNERNI